MTGDSADGGRGKVLQSPHGHRKRNRNLASSRSDSRATPRHHPRRHHGDRRSSVNSGRSNTPPSARARRSIGCHDEFLEDVHFDVVPKDMSVAASQEVARGDDSVVRQQLRSLGSVLAGGKGNIAEISAEQGAECDPCHGNGGSRGTSRNGSISGGNLLYRWLQPTPTATGQGPINGNLGRNSVRCEAFSGDADAAQQSSSGGGFSGRAVGDLAKKALLRKKMADAERGRRLRLQREEAPSSNGSGAPRTLETNNVVPARPAGASQPTSGVAEFMEAPADAVALDKRPPPQMNSSTKSADLAETPSSSDFAVTEVAIKSCSLASAGLAKVVTAPSGGDGGFTVEEEEQEDEYGDDFAFLTDADLQALEEDATRKSAAAAEAVALSQRASQQASDGETPPPTSESEVVVLESPPPFKVAWTAGSKRLFGSGSRPPLTVLGPNPKRSDHPRRSDSTSSTAALVASGDASSCSASSAGSSQDVDRAGRWSTARGRTAPGRGEGARHDRRAPPGVPATIASRTAPDTRLGEAPAATGTATVDHAKLFTTFGSMEEFTRSTGRNRPASQEGAAGVPPHKGQGCLTDWAQQPRTSQQSRTSQQPRGSQGATGLQGAAGAATSVANPGASATASSRAEPFVPALVHRRFFVLEVTYASVQSGKGSREKVLMSIEQLPPGSVTIEENRGEGDAPPHVARHAQAGSGGLGAAQERRREISLLGDWYDCDVEPGDVVHVLFPSSEGRGGAAWEADEAALSSRHVVVDNASGRLLVVHPDILVSPTKVADTVLCARKAVLQSRLASDASRSKAAVLGNLKHELFETSLHEAVSAATARSIPSPGSNGNRAGRSPAAAAAALTWRGNRGGDFLTSQRMATLVDRIVLSQLEALYGADLDEGTARGELLSVSGPIVAWHRAFLAKPDADAARNGGFVSLGSNEAPAARVSVSRVLATEDDVWSPVLGLKGIMDATVEAVVRPLARSPRGQGPGGGGVGPQTVMAFNDGGVERPLVMPVEVKTGKRVGEARVGHRAQVMLYTLLLRMRYGNEASTSGLLVYTSAEGLHTELVSPAAAELRALILARNRHATGMAKIGRVGLVTGHEAGRGEQGGAALPPVIRRARDCGMCFQNSECMLYHRAVEGGDEESSGLEPGVFDSKVGHVTEAHLAFFAHWDRTIDLEAKIGEQVRRTMWQESGPERESRTNKCMSGLVWLGEREHDDLDNADTSSKPQGGKGGKRFTHVFCREWAVPEVFRRGVPETDGGVSVTKRRHAANAPRGPSSSSRPDWIKPLTDLSISVGDMVCVSAQGNIGTSPPLRRRGREDVDHVRLLTGSIGAVFEDRLEVLSDKRLRVPRRGSRRGDGVRSARAGVGACDALDIEDLLGTEAGAREDSGLAKGRVLFRIDRDEWAASISMMRSNLVKLMAGPPPESEATAADAKDGRDNTGDEKRRRLIVDLEAPRFGRFTGLLDVPGTLLEWSGDRGGDSKSDRPRRSETGAAGEAGVVATRQKLKVMFRTALNEDQRAAVRKVVTAKDYALLLGMPGTGKTWTIAFAVRVLLARGASVLITSYTHSAVDNLLLKLVAEGVPCLRVGKPSSVHPGVRSCCINHDGSATTTAAYSELVASARVVGCTCLGVKHPLFSRRRFDYCIVDEAGQISQPVVLAPLRCADVFVLVGDHYQLPPLVTSSEALEAGMSESLFRRLCEAHPASLQRLSYQYRMNADVMALCNDLTYSGRLRCGNARVEHQQLLIPNLAALPAPRPPSEKGRLQHGSSKLRPWLSEVLDPARRVVFLDTDAMSSAEDRRTAEGALASGGGRGARLFAGLETRSAVPEDGGMGALVNTVECDVVCLLSWGLDVSGFDIGKVGVISPYRSQVRLLQVRLKAPFPTLEINTIDKYQGRDKEVIVVSFVRSNAEGTVGHLLRDWRRLNVALSRAKRKLVLIGSLRTFSSCAVLLSLAGILKTRGWVYSLPRGANQMYPLGLAGLEEPGDRRDTTVVAGVKTAADGYAVGSDREPNRMFPGNTVGEFHSKSGSKSVRESSETGLPARSRVGTAPSSVEESLTGVRLSGAGIARAGKWRPRSAD